MSDAQQKTAAEMVGEAKGRVENLTPSPPNSWALKLREEVLPSHRHREDDERVQNGTIPARIGRGHPE